MTGFLVFMICLSTLQIGLSLNYLIVVILFALIPRSLFFLRIIGIEIGRYKMISGEVIPSFFMALWLGYPWYNLLFSVIVFLVYLYFDKTRVIVEVESEVDTRTNIVLGDLAEIQEREEKFKRTQEKRNARLERAKQRRERRGR